jgi:hypothetical protein
MGDDADRFAGIGFAGRRRLAERLPPYTLDARRRYFHSHSFVYAAAVDACMLLRQCLWKLRVLLTGKEDNSPPHLLGDSFRHSVFMRGFQIEEVENPALKKTQLLNSPVLSFSARFYHFRGKNRSFSRLIRHPREHRLWEQGAEEARVFATVPRGRCSSG